MRPVQDKSMVNRVVLAAIALLSIGAATGCKKAEAPENGPHAVPTTSEVAPTTASGAPGATPQLPRGVDPRAEVPPPGPPRPMSGTR